MKLSILFFSAEFRPEQRHSYDFVLAAARFADAHGFHAVWLPERHFHPFGGLYPNPAVIAAAIAAQTQRIRIRAGSVVLPLHHPVRVAEDWAMVDRLAGGRVDLSFSKGWNRSEFVFRADAAGYGDEAMFRDIDTIRSLWQGATLPFATADGPPRNVSIYPRPTDGALRFWVSTFNEALFERTARTGGNVLTGLLLQSPAELGRKIARFRAAAAPTAQLTLMLHTFVAPTREAALATVGTPLRNYLANSMSLWQQQAPQLDLDPAAREKVLDFACARYLKESTLIGGPDAVAAGIDRFAALGVDEIACLLDFGAPEAAILESLSLLATHLR